MQTTSRASKCMNALTTISQLARSRNNPKKSLWLRASVSRMKVWKALTPTFHNRYQFSTAERRTSPICMRDLEDLLCLNSRSSRISFASTRIRQTSKTGSVRIATKTFPSSTASSTTTRARWASSSKYAMKISSLPTFSTKILTSTFWVRKTGTDYQQAISRPPPPRSSKINSTDHRYDRLTWSILSTNPKTFLSCANTCFTVFRKTNS